MKKKALTFTQEETNISAQKTRLIFLSIKKKKYQSQCKQKY